MKKIDNNSKLLILSIVILVINTILVFLFNSFERIVYTIFFYHVAMAWVTYISFSVSLVFHIRFLLKKERKWVILGKNSVIAGVFFAIITLISGMIWYNATTEVFNAEFSGFYSNKYWDWSDPRMVMTLILLLTYVAYLIFGNLIDDREKSEKFRAIWNIISFPSIPLSYLSAILFPTAHPLIQPEGRGSIYWEPMKFLSLFLNLIAITIFFIYIVKELTELDRKKDELDKLIQSELERES